MPSASAASAASALQAQARAHPEFAAEYAALEDLAARKLYHQLSEALLAFARDPRCGAGENLLQLYELFVAPVEAHLSPLRVVQLVGLAARQCYPTRPFVVHELDRALELVSRQVARRALTGEERLPDDAYLAASMEATLLRVRRACALAAAPPSSASASASAAAAAAESALDDVKRELAAGRALLEQLADGSEPAAPAAYYRAAAEYYKVRGPAHAFYAAALSYLGHTPLAALPADERAALAVDVALAALVGEGVYNFGEVNAHRILDSLAGTPHAWLVELLRAFQHGDIDAFAGAVGANAAAFAAAPALAASAPALKEKIALLAVMELAARRPALGRVLAFADVAAATRLPAEQVEWLLMRALSLGLIAGDIDEVARTVSVTFVKPRVLDAAQIADLAGGVRAWRAKADTMLAYMEDATREVFK